MEPHPDITPPVDPEQLDDQGDAVVRRSREDTAPRRHAFLRQTVPPNDPQVREIERRRSGQDTD